MAQVIVLARYEDEVMEPLTRPDEARTWNGCFVQIPWFVGGWHIDVPRRGPRRGGHPRHPASAHRWVPWDADPGFLVQTGLGRGEERHSPEHVQDPRSCW